MSSVLRVCRKCGAEIFADAPEGLCTACLFETGLSLLANDSQSTCEGGSARRGEMINASGEHVPPHKAERIPLKTFTNFGFQTIGKTSQDIVSAKAMPPESQASVQLQIGHVLFMDLVGYSTLLLDEQRQFQQQLADIVRDTKQVRIAKEAGKLIRLPVGDGMALVFFDSPEAPVRCAIEISKRLREHPQLKLRMGIHSGPISEVRDVNDQTNVAGAGINLARRVMDCGDGGHILISKRVAEDLAQSPRWTPYLHDLGECAVKHGVPVFLVNFYGDELGNPELPKMIQHAQVEQGASHKAERIPPKTFANFGDYELLEVIGRGGQGVVYRARQKSLNRTVALKVIGLGHWATDAHLKRFRREAEAAASLDHPGIVPIYEVGERDGSCYFSMKLIEGGQLDEVVKRQLMPIRQAVELIANVARTVHYAHEHSILHRDIKPGNILLDQKGEPHLTDFGLARLVETESTVTRTLEVLGTPSYMAPEQAVGNNAAVSRVADVYGLGAVLYQLLTGHPPFAGGTTYETIKLLLDTEPRQPRLWNSKIDRDLSTICLKCLEKDPKRRYSSALALAEDLERWLKHEPILARHAGILIRSKKWVRRNPTSALLAASLVALAAAAGWIISKSEFIRHPLTTGIAVLPFENLSDEKEHAFFADGVQDDILTKLAKIADLKVISRSSVMQYRGKQNAREIGDTLRVSHVLEGSVRRDGAKIHLNAQLIDTRSDTHVWAEQYDRDLTEMFAIQSEIAQKVAEQLHAKLSASEKLAIESKPTADLAAFDLYTRAKSILAGPDSTQKELLQAVDLLNQAVARDPSFFDAYCELAYAHDVVYNQYIDHTSARLALAAAAVEAAVRLRPDAGETHLARARNLYWGYWDYDGALAELKIAHQTLPNDFRIPWWTAYIQNRQGHWEEGTRNLERAIELNPRNMETRVDIALHYTALRRYADLKSALASTLAVFPNDLDTRIWPAYAEFQEKADTRPLHQMLDRIRYPARMRDISEWPLACALAERDATAATNALDANRADRIRLGNEVFFNRSFVEGLIALIEKDEGKARLAFVAARAEQEKVLQAQHNDNGLELSLLGLIDAYLGRKDEALREGRGAVALLRAGKDVSEGVWAVTNLAMIAACVGDKDLAFEQLESIIRLPNPLSYGGLKLFPWWDPLRGDPRFERILKKAKQPVALK